MQMKWLMAVCGGLLAVTAPACEQEEIRTYDAPKAPVAAPPTASETPRAPARGGHNHGGQRMIAAIVPRDDRTWFFRLSGPAAHVADEARAYGGFIRSLRFTDDGPAWQAPPHWQELPAEGMRYAAYRAGQGDHAVELTVIPLGTEAADVLANVNRWRGQLGLDPIEADQLGDVAQTMEIGGLPITLVDMTGPGDGSGGSRTPPFAGGPPSGAQAPSAGDSPRPPSADSTGDALSYTVPDGWTEEPASGMRAASFKAGPGEPAADVSVIPLAGIAGGTLPNINRWRGEIGLERIEREQLERDLKTLPIDGDGEAQYVDLAGPESSDGRRLGTLAAIYQRDDTSWFFKLTGPAQLVSEQKQAFEQFVRSVRFEDQQAGEPAGSGY